MIIIRNTITLLKFFLIILLFSACGKLDKEGPATATISISLDHSQSSSRMARTITSFTADVDTELIALVTDNTTFNRQYLSLENRYQFALTDLSTDTVSLTVPLDTGIKLYSYAYLDDSYTLSELKNTAILAEQFGETNSFTISSGDTSKEVSLKYFYAQMGGSIQGTELALSTAVTTLAGSSSGTTDNDNGTLARFSGPMGITTDGTNLYVADRNNHKIRKIVISTGVVTTLAGSSSGYTDDNGTSAAFNKPWGITTDGANLYVADTSNYRIRKIVISTGVVTTLAGSSSGYTDDNGTSAKFSSPQGITTDGTNLYVADRSNHRIRKIVISTGVVTTIAGSGTVGSTDDNGTSAKFSSPYEITTDGTNLYVSDLGNHRIRKIVISTGVVTTLAGSSSGYTNNNTGTSAQFYNPIGITTDGTNLYVADYSNHRIRKIVISTGVVTTIAGSGTGGSTDDNGTSAKFSNPWGITTDGTNLYVADFSNHRIRKID